MPIIRICGSGRSAGEPDGRRSQPQGFSTRTPPFRERRSPVASGGKKRNPKQNFGLSDGGDEKPISGIRVPPFHHARGREPLRQLGHEVGVNDRHLSGPRLKDRRLAHRLPGNVGDFESSELSETRVDFLGEAAALLWRERESGGENLPRLRLHGALVARCACAQAGLHEIVEAPNEKASHSRLIAPISYANQN